MMAQSLGVGQVGGGVGVGWGCVGKCLKTSSLIQDTLLNLI